ncbi:3-keto-disaccharide hydrolase [Ohtaekwangia sp.]|uniref:3-keto-disaccharide hydrolase n=1 Tax=Ohtaekwangia sp. TaxID=2066019 RepID=UPI002FDD3BAD
MARLLYILGMLLSSVYVTAQSSAHKKEWIKLFNGRDINDWIVKIHHHDVGVNFGNTFRVKDGIIQVRYDQYGDFNDQFAHLYYKQPFSYYHLKVEYRFTGQLQKGAPDYTLRNSGIMFHSQDPRTMPKEQDWPISVEMQLLGGLGDGKPRTTGNMCSPGTAIVYEGKLDERHCINSTSKTYDGDQWVHAELIVLGDSLITHIINGNTVMRYSKPQMAGGVVKNYDSTIWQPGKPLREGFIALQSEGQPVDFRNVEILPLKGCMDPNAVNYKDYYVASDPASCRYKKKK